MTADNEDAKLSERYRGLPPEEPPQEIDRSILAAARRAVDARPRAAKSGARRWAVPVSLAAVVVLSTIVTLNVQREQPGFEPPASADSPRTERPSRPVAEASPAEAGPAQAKPSLSTRTQESEHRAPSGAGPQVGAERRREEASTTARGGFAAEPAPRSAPSAAMTDSKQSPPAGPGAPQAGRPAAPIAPGRPERESADREAFARTAPAASQDRAMQLGATESPEKWLERIVRLREQGRRDEAERQLEEFRRRYPSYRIPEAMRARVLGRD